MSEQKNARELLILRHAKSAWDTNAAMDYDRPLAKRGKRDAKRIGNWLREQEIMLDSILSSPALRAVQTTHVICETLHIDAGRVVWDERIYEATADSLLDLVRERPERERIVLLVGHNPGLEHLMLYLCGDAVEIPEDGKLLPTATVAWLGVAREWNTLTKGTVTLRSITRPGSLPD